MNLVDLATVRTTFPYTMIERGRHRHCILCNTSFISAYEHWDISHDDQEEPYFCECPQCDHDAIHLYYVLDREINPVDEVGYRCIPCVRGEHHERDLDHLRREGYL